VQNVVIKPADHVQTAGTEPADRVHTAGTEPADRVHTAGTEPADRVHTAGTEPADHVQRVEQSIVFTSLKYSRTSFIRINWDGQPSAYAENPDNWTLLESRLH